MESRSSDVESPEPEGPETISAGPPRPARRALPWRWIVAAVAAAALGAAPLLARRTIAVWRAEQALPRGETPSVLVVTLDSVRADRLGFAGYGPIETPRLDALAGEGVVFESAYAQAVLGVPAHATILTGLLPGHHGVHDDTGGSLAPDAPMVGEAFQRAGYRTAAFVSASDLDRQTGFARGFDLYHDDFGAAGKKATPSGSAPASETVFRALSWLSDNDARPAFLWVHLAAAARLDALPEPQATTYRDRPYDGAIALLDQEIGRLVDGVRAARALTLVAVLADHGEALGDHGEPRHGLFLYSATTRIPFVLSMPGRLPSARRVPAVVRAMDLVPTLLDICGLPAPARSDGSSLVPLVVGRTEAEPGPAPIENASLPAKYGFSPLAALRSGPYLYVRAPRPELYDVGQDPSETDDAAERLPDVVRRLEQQLATMIADPPQRRTLPDPKDQRDLFTRYVIATRFAGEGRLDRAEVAFRSILSEAPGFVLARRHLAVVLLDQARVPEAAALLQELIDSRQADETTYLNLALIAFRQKKTERALEILQSGLRAHPESVPLRHRTGRVLLLLQQNAEAAALLRRALELEPRLSDAQLALAEALERLGRLDEARAVLAQLATLAPLSEEGKEASGKLQRLKATGQPAGQ